MDPSSLGIFFFVCSVTLPFVFFLLMPSTKRGNLPPGPCPWPIVGNLPYFLRRLRASNQDVHKALRTIADDYGPISYLRLGSWDIVLASSPSAASHVLRTCDRTLRGSHIPCAYRIPEMTDYSIIWNFECDDNWRSLRSTLKTHLASLPSLRRHALMREKKAMEMAQFIQSRAGDQVQVGEVVFTTVYNILGNLIFSRDVLSLEKGQGWFPEMKNHMNKMIDLGAQLSIEDFFPKLVRGFDVQGLRSEMRIYLNKVYSKWDEVLMQRNGETKEEDLATALLRDGISLAQLKVFILEIFAAGTDTTTILTSWVMSELLRNPEIMTRVKNELKEVMCSSSSARQQGLAVPDESQITRLTLLHACAKEALRLHTPFPVMSHRAITDCEVMGYSVPKDCTVFVNIWAIARDPTFWESPLLFLPDRFLSGKLDYMGSDFEFIPFGAGSRMCPGMSLAIRIVLLVVATMLYNFQWDLPGGKPPSELNMDEKVGLVLERKEPLVLIPTPL
ncbi:(S)-N-methylcoclaurine 3'-hydroxylase isozyme 1-like [Wolffia australiana]